jgi:hypothetical protein
VNGDTPDAPDDTNLFAPLDDDDSEAAEEAARMARPAVGAVTPIRDPADEPFVFRFEVGPAILKQLLEKLETLSVQPLDDCLGARHPGFYQIFLDGKPVYIGKASRPIGERLREHKRKLRGRIPLTRIGCRFAYVEDPSLVDMAEGLLIKFFEAYSAADWNRSGFGSKTTGYGRAGTRLAKWDTDFPLDFNWQIETGSAKPITLAALVRKVASEAPLPFSIPTKHRAAFNAAHPGTLNVPVATRSFKQWVTFIERNLSAGWVVQREPRTWYIVPA